MVLWVEHSQTLRFSVLESVLARSNGNGCAGSFSDMAGIVHGRVLEPREPTVGPPSRRLGLAGRLPRAGRSAREVLDELDRKLPRAQAVRLLETVLQAVVENYEEYRDYNTTTTQSDYGENLFVLLDFLRLKAGYERDNWRMRPLVLVHEVLCRRDRIAALPVGNEMLVHYTREHADRHLCDLAQVENRHGLKLRTIRDRLGERFIAPLVIDRMCARWRPRSRGRSVAGGDSPAFGRLCREIEQFTANPAGVGLDTPGGCGGWRSKSIGTPQQPKRGRAAPIAADRRTTAAPDKSEWGGAWTNEGGGGETPQTVIE